MTGSRWNFADNHVKLGTHPDGASEVREGKWPMNRGKARRIGIAIVVVVLFFTGYSYFFRTYFDSQEYLLLAYEYTGRDPTIVDWEYPDFEIISHKGRLTLHIIFHTTEDLTRGPIGLYIDPFKKQVVDVDPRSDTAGKHEKTS